MEGEVGGGRKGEPASQQQDGRAHRKHIARATERHTVKMRCRGTRNEYTGFMRQQIRHSAPQDPHIMLVYSNAQSILYYENTRE